MAKSDFLHASIKIKGTVVSQASGWFEFDDESAGIGAGFRSKEFERYKEGTRLECSFRASKERRQLLYIRQIVDDGYPPYSAELKLEPAVAVEEFPSSIGDYYVPEEVRLLLSTTCNIVEAGGHINLLARGASGYGKTSLYEALGQHLGYKVVMINCAAIMDAEQWFGYQEARDGETVFLPSEFSKAVTEGKCVIVLDEANRIEPWLANSLLPMLDHRRRTVVHGQEIVAGPSIVFAHTVNEGVRFAGTHVMDAAYLNRIDAIVEVGQLPINEEVSQLVKRTGIEQKIASQIVNINRTLRNTVERNAIDIDVSTRSSLKIANLVKHGMSVNKAFEYVVINAAAQEDRKAIVDVVNVAWRDVSSAPTGEAKSVEEEDEYAHIRALVKMGKKINAIKAYRELTDCSLKEARDFVEALT